MKAFAYNPAKRSRSGFLKLLAVLALVGLMAWWANRSARETTAQRRIINDVRDLIESCHTAGDKPTLVGRALVWDIRTNSRSRAHRKLPRVLRADSSDTPITVFMVVAERNVKVGTYSISGQPAYRQYMDIAIALWPKKKPLGFVSVVSKEPRSSRQVQQRPEYGDPDEPIAGWIKSLLRTNP